MILLYVDDDAEDILLFNEAIEIIGSTYSCITAGNGEDALCILNVVIPDIIFLDVNMPIMNGQETLKAIRQDMQLNTIPVCMLSTSSNEQEIETYKQLGATEFIVKQTTFERFCNNLADFLNGLTREGLTVG